MQMDAGTRYRCDALPACRWSSAAVHTAGSLHDELSIIGAEALLEALTGLARGEMHPSRSQPKASPTRRKIEKAEARIDWTRQAGEIERQIRAFNPWPVAETLLDGDAAAHLFRRERRRSPAKTVAKSRRTGYDSAGSGTMFFAVRCGEGCWRSPRSSSPGATPVGARDFAHAPCGCDSGRPHLARRPPLGAGGPGAGRRRARHRRRSLPTGSPPMRRWPRPSQRPIGPRCAPSPWARCAGTCGSCRRSSRCSAARSVSARHARAARRRRASDRVLAQSGGADRAHGGRRGAPAGAAQARQACERGAAPLRRRARRVLRSAWTRKLAARTAHPEWLVEEVRRAWPEQVGQMLDANNAASAHDPAGESRPASRVTAYLEPPHGAGIAARAHTVDGIGRRSGAPGRRHRAAGIQRRAASRCRTPARSSPPSCSMRRPAMRVLDACAAPGGKTGHLLERTRGWSSSLAVDLEAPRVALGSRRTSHRLGRTRTDADRGRSAIRRPSGTAKPSRSHPGRRPLLLHRRHPPSPGHQAAAPRQRHRGARQTPAGHPA